MPVFDYETYKTYVRMDNPKYHKTFSSIRTSGLRSLLIAHDGEDFAKLPKSEKDKITNALKKIEGHYVNVRKYINQCLAMSPSLPVVSTTMLHNAKGARHHVTDSPMNKVLTGVPQTHNELTSLDLHKMTGSVNIIFSKCPIWEEVGIYAALWTSDTRCNPSAGNGNDVDKAACETALNQRGRNPGRNLAGFLAECQGILTMIEKAMDKLLAGTRALTTIANLNTTTNSDILSCKKFWGSFGTVEATRRHWNTVHKKYGEMRTCLVPSRTGNQELLRVVESSAAPCGQGSYAFTYPSTRRPPFIWLGEAIFEDQTGGIVLRPPLTKAYVRYDNTRMTLLHELSHATLGTDDVAPYRKHNTYHAGATATRLSALAADADYPGTGAGESEQTISLGTDASGRTYFTKKDIFDLAEHRPKWTAVNAHHYACFGAHCDTKCPGSFWRI